VAASAGHAERVAAVRVDRAITTGPAAGAEPPPPDPNPGDAGFGNPTLGEDGPVPGSECVFCHPEVQPATLFETPLLRVLPDKFPLLPGHVLVVSRRHLRCYGAATEAELQDLDRAAARVAPFLSARYGKVLIFENGVAGQSVPHAHLHLIPANLDGFPDEEDGWERCTGLGALPNRFARSGPYHYAEIGGEARVLAPNGALVWRMRAALAIAGRLRRGDDGRFHRVTKQADVEELARRWRMEAEA
jgi:diadenosine tetraphosphate (Ap4A) HIT family hydrolase